MNRQPITIWLVLIALAALLVTGLGQVLARAQAQDDKPAKKTNTWQPPVEDRADYRDIVDYNIFRSDRRRIAEQVDRERNPPEPRDPTPRDPVRPVDVTPPDPDSLWRLAGITHDPDGTVAYIEHIQSGELSKLTGPTEFSSGEVTAIGYDALMYVVADQQRTIRIGQVLTGERVVPAGSGVRSSSGSSSKPSGDLSPAERLKMLREQRARDLGTAPPEPAPTPDGGAAPDDDTDTRDGDTPEQAIEILSDEQDDSDTDTDPSTDAGRETGRGNNP